MDTTLPTQIELQVVTPEQVAVSATATSVSLPGASGRLGILPGHAPLISELAPGVLWFSEKGSDHYLAIGEGFAEVLQGRVIVLAQTAEKAEAIELDRARREKQSAEEALKKPGISEAEAKQAEASIKRAEARLEAAAQAKRG
ncbi:MAG TPA: ATP synthase F1 subunit epsilon [Terriglobia bacterium]|nr:ATP synthase F1 subunit epsilon [Terriglobia bacterium]